MQIDGRSAFKIKNWTPSYSVDNLCFGSRDELQRNFYLVNGTEGDAVLRLIIWLALAFVLCNAAAAQERLALVIGIDRYENIGDLQKAGNDARSIAAALDGVGFGVTELINPERLELRRVMAKFSRQISPGDEVVFYFAGHGIEVQGRNYLLPSDVPEVRPGEEDFVTGESIAADQILDLIQSRGARVAMMILDACRDNPFPTQGTRSVGASGGLSRMEPAEGAFILFSAGAGQTALDRLSDNDPNPNSVFTRALLARMGTPGLALHDLVRHVRSDVRELASTVNHPQFPAYYDQLQGDFMFGGNGSAAVAPKLEAAVPVVPQPNPCDAARADWNVLQGTQSASALEAFVATYARCPIYVAAAQDRLQSLSTAVQPTARAVTPPPPTTCEQLWYARNLIFHNNGFCFQTGRAQAAFDTSQCTTRNPSLTSAEQNEVQRLRNLENANGC